MIDITVYFKNGDKLDLRVDSTLEKLNVGLNKFNFIRLGPVIINASEIVIIKEGE